MPAIKTSWNLRPEWILQPLATAFNLLYPTNPYPRWKFRGSSGCGGFVELSCQLFEWLFHRHKLYPGSTREHRTINECGNPNIKLILPRSHQWSSFKFLLSVFSLLICLANTIDSHKRTRMSTLRYNHIVNRTVARRIKLHEVAFWIRTWETFHPLSARWRVPCESSGPKTRCISQMLLYRDLALLPAFCVD